MICVNLLWRHSRVGKSGNESNAQALYGVRKFLSLACCRNFTAKLMFIFC